MGAKVELISDFVKWTVGGLFVLIVSSLCCLV